MASDSCTTDSSLKQRKTNGGKIIEGNSRKACPIPNPEVGKLDPSAKEVSSTVQNSASKEFTTETLLETTFVSCLSGKVDSNLRLGSSKQVQTPNRAKKTADDAGNIKNLAASTKVSDGENGVTKANGGAKNIDQNDFVESGKSSVCGVARAQTHVMKVLAAASVAVLTSHTRQMT